MAPSPQPRSTVLAIPAYVAGKPPVAREGLTSYKLSSNENPYPPLPGVLEAATEAAAQMNRYPDMGSTALYAALGEAMGVPVGDLAAATGSVGLIYQLVNAFCDPGDEVVYAWRSFEAYPLLTGLAGATPIHVPLREETHDLEALAAAVTDRTRMVFVCNPNNPTGTAIRRAALESFLDRVPEDVLVVLDEATGSLDTASEALIQAALTNLLRGRTAFIIAHRLATVIHSDLIVVLDGGLVIQKGTHAELLAQPDGLYRRLCERQFGDPSPSGRRRRVALSIGRPSPGEVHHHPQGRSSA